MRKIHELQLEESEFNINYNNQKHVLVLEKEKYNQYDYVLITSIDKSNARDVLLELLEVVENKNLNDSFVIFKTNQIQKGV